MKQETVIFPIKNLTELSADYFLYEIVGLNHTDEDYDINIQYIVKSLSYRLRHPITSITKNDAIFLVVRDELGILLKIPNEYYVKRDVLVHFRQHPDKFNLDFKNYDEQSKAIILRFLQFDIQSELNKNPSLWQPSSGDAFYNENAFEVHENVAIYNGFFIRVVELPVGGFGLAMDVTKKYISETPLNMHLTRKQFKELHIKGSHFVYQYGMKKYEVRADQYSDLNASQYKFQRPSDGELVTLIEDTQEKFGKSMPPNVASLPDDASVLIYKTNDNNERRIIAGLCYKVFDTEDSRVSKLHKKSIIIPFFRRRFIRAVRAKFLKNIMYGTIKLEISEQPLQIEKNKFITPDYIFGRDTILSVRGVSDGINTNINQLGRIRKNLLLDENVGFYTTATFETQYFVVPQTVYNMYGNQKYFLEDLTNKVNRMHPTEDGWNPTIITYDDRNKKDAVQIGFEILKNIEENIDKKGGYAVVMLPSDVNRIKRQHDDTAALVVSQCLKDYDITASVMHSDTLKDCYIHKLNNGQSSYVVRHERAGKYKGYVYGVAINQVLLNNERWPYILNTPLHADLTIGIDVKKKLAGFTFIDKFSKNILTKFDESDNKERLSSSQIIKIFVKNINFICSKSSDPISKIVIHRDGRLFQPEKEGILAAIEILKTKKILPVDVTVNFVEIPKHSTIPFRLFDIKQEFDIYKQKSDNGYVLNPEIGTYCILNKREAFLCTTGREFNHGGSSNPLYMKYNSGFMEIEEILEDIYSLSCLAYTKPDDCSRFPITIKITDRRINILGSEYDNQQLDVLKAIYE